MVLTPVRRHKYLLVVLTTPLPNHLLSIISFWDKDVVRPQDAF